MMARHKVGNIDDWPVFRTSDSYIAWCPVCHYGYPDEQALGRSHCAGSQKHPHEPTRLVGLLKVADVQQHLQGKVPLGYVRLKYDPPEDQPRVVHHEDPPIERVEETGRLKCNGPCGLTFGPYYWEDGEVCPVCGGHLCYAVPA